MPPAPATGRKDAAYEQIRRLILDNVWPPGHQALEQEIALQLGVSRTPVREALIRLEQDGLLQIVPRHGIRVLPMSAQDMRELYEVLTALESLAAELLALQRPDRDTLAPLVQATDAMAQALEQDDLDSWARADEDFHARLVTLCGNRMLAEAVFSHWDRAHRARMFTLRLRPKPLESTREHRALIDCLLAGDSAGAGAVNRAHRQRASRELLSLFDRLRLQQL
ncbi:GntR family transcriptional regulator [Xylophilus rhododendri]|nr:GntR family transcriptional regulator [Xylophilus rhododendri]